MTCPDPGQIAAHVDRRLTAVEAARMDEHIAGCADCTQVFADTVEFGLAEGEAAGVHRAADPAAATPRSAVPQSWLRLAAGVVLAAGLAGFLGWFTLSTGRHSSSPVAQLVQAIGARRFVEPRLTGGFAHGRLVVLRSGEVPQKLDAQPAAVIAAVARIRAQAEGDTSPRTLGALGITYLVSGDVAAAVKALESATAQEPDNPGLWSDLAAAYLARAEQMDEPADLPKALEVAEKAITLKDPPTEVWFNRALALEKLHLVDAARKAWEDYLQRDAASGWADEARQHLEALPKPRQSSVEEDKARVKAALEGGQAAVDILADEDPSLLRDYFEDDLLPAWAEARLVGHPDANLHREHARLIGDALFRTTTDALPRDTARALNEPEATATSTDALRSQALGFRILREAKRLYDLQEQACGHYRQAHRNLETGGSPYSAWAGQQLVTSCLLSSEPTAAVLELDRLSSLAEAHAYGQLLGRVTWLHALILGYRGDLTESLQMYRSSHALFQRTRDLESQGRIFGAIGETLSLLGDKRGAWGQRQQGFALLAQMRSPRRRHFMFSDALVACLGERMPRSALHFGSALVETSFEWSRAAAISEALMLRARIHHSLGDDERASIDSLEARHWIDRIAEESVARRERAEVDAVDGEILVGPRPEEAIRALDGSLAYFGRYAPARLPALRLLRARGLSARGRVDAAQADLALGIRAVESQGFSFPDAALQGSFLDQAFPLFDDMVRLQIGKRHDPARALTFVERSRGRQLVDALTPKALGNDGRRLTPRLATPIEPEALRQSLPAGLALIYYASLDDSLYLWVLTRQESHFLERPLSSVQLSRLVAAQRAAVEGRAALSVVRAAGARLHDELVRPLLPFLTSERALVVIPDSVVQAVAFASLWDRDTGHYLVEDYLLGLAPSGTVFLQASNATVAMLEGRPRALVVGNPHFDRHLWVGLPGLPGAEAEASEIAALYTDSKLLTGSEATKNAFLEGLPTSQIVHFAGHAASTDDALSDARFLFAPDPRKRDSGALYLRELAGQSLAATRVVVLAACRTAAGRVSRVEGALSLGRPFLAAGVPDVVGSLWDIDDKLSRRFFLALHRSLVKGEDPVLALRTAQLSLLRGDDATLAHPASWAAFICTGGLDPRSFSKGVVS